MPYGGRRGARPRGTASNAASRGRREERRDGAGGLRDDKDMAMRTELFDYFLPPEMIAQHPLPDRDASRMMVLRRDGRISEDSLFRRFPGYLRRGDLLVMNNSRVIKARLRGVREKTGGKIEVLLVRPWTDHDESSFKRLPGNFEHGALNPKEAFLPSEGFCTGSEAGVVEASSRGERSGSAGPAGSAGGRAGEIAGGPGDAAVNALDRKGAAGEVPAGNRWLVLTKSGGRLTVGERLILGGGALSATLLRRLGNDGDLVEFDTAGVNFQEVLDRTGEVPLPPYLRRQPLPEDAERYQTVYAEAPGSVAAPTAGLHFSIEVLKAVEAVGVRRAELTLHVGPGTFQPVKSREIEEHRIGKEIYTVSEETVRAVLETKASGGRVVAVGTTTLRVLETLARTGAFAPAAKPARAGGITDLFVYPPFEFKAVDALLTNFHLPRSTLLMLVCAFASPGRTDGIGWILDRYEHAKRAGYRFYSYGDCMLIL
ncbi:MAG: tRNA preQ1(34) S-adenosylmethionine ribosyltransferase-isomerase QueA [Planctomycetota bacterium]|nr:tRNA preQ1(34) S-adenosylmethionine ribosyltransferase-isomerase QueA [Planctomycetota bacterium]